MTRWLFLAGAIVLEVSGSLSLKGALEAPALYAVVVIGYVGSFLCLFQSLGRGMALGVGYGIWGATGVALTAVMSRLLFDEPITVLMAVGIALIMGGVLLVEVGSQAAQKASADGAEAAR